MSNMSLTGASSLLTGRHLLILEDEMILALDLSDIVQSFGCTSVIAARVGKAVQLLATQKVDVAILDLNVAGEPSYPVADELRRRAVPFIFATGYGADGVLPDYRHHPILAKPYSRREVETALLQALTPKDR